MKAASFILSTTLGGKGKKKVKRGPPLWDAKKFAAGQYFSQTAYWKVVKVAPITVENSFGN